MRLALCEDSAIDRKQIEKSLCMAADAMQMKVCVESYAGAEKLLEKIRTGYRYDAYVLDIYMQGIDGLRLAREIRNKDRKAKIAFVTSSREFAIEAFEVRAVHYLLKPVGAENSRELLERLTLEERKEKPVFTFNSGRSSVQFKQEDIVMIESYSHGVLVHKRGRKEPYWFRMLFSDVEQQASDLYFVKANRGILVNLKDVEKVEKQHCYIRNGKYISVSRRQMSDFKKAYVNYLFASMNGDSNVDG